MRTVQDLVHELQELCMCEDVVPDGEQCIYCESREQIEALQRTIRLLSERRASDSNSRNSTGETI